MKTIITLFIAIACAARAQLIPPGTTAQLVPIAPATSGGGGIGSGVSPQIAYFVAPNSVGGNSNFTYTAATGSITVGVLGSSNTVTITADTNGGLTVTAGGTNQSFTYNTTGTGNFAINSAGTSTNQSILSMLEAGLVGSAGPYFSIGVANSAKNATVVQFNYQGGAGSNSNFASLGCFGSNGINVFASARAGVGAVTTDDGVHTFQVGTTGGIATVTAGGTLSVKSGSNALAGTVTLTSGAGTIASTAIDANTVVYFTVKTASGTFTQQPYVATITPGTGCTVAGTVTDNSTYNWVALKVN